SAGAASAGATRFAALPPTTKESATAATATAATTATSEAAVRTEGPDMRSCYPEDGRRTSAPPWHLSEDLGAPRVACAAKDRVCPLERALAQLLHAAGPGELREREA